MKKEGRQEGTGAMFPANSFMPPYEVQTGQRYCVLASTVPGKILAIDTAKTSLIAVKGAFCAHRQRSKSPY